MKGAFFVLWEFTSSLPCKTILWWSSWLKYPINYCIYKLKCEKGMLYFNPLQYLTILAHSWTVTSWHHCKRIRESALWNLWFQNIGYLYYEGATASFFSVSVFDHIIFWGSKTSGRMGFPFLKIYEYSLVLFWLTGQKVEHHLWKGRIAGKWKVEHHLWKGRIAGKWSTLCTVHHLACLCSTPGSVQYTLGDIMSTPGDVQYTGVSIQIQLFSQWPSPHTYHDIPPVYSWHPSVYWTPPVYSWYPPLYSWYPPLCCTPPSVLHRHYVGWFILPDKFLFQPAFTRSLIRFRLIEFRTIQ